MPDPTMTPRITEPIEWQGNAYTGIAAATTHAARCEICRWSVHLDRPQAKHRLWSVASYREPNMRYDLGAEMSVVLGPMNINQVKDEASILLRWATDSFTKETQP